MVYAATSSEINGITGRYFGDMKVCGIVCSFIGYSYAVVVNCLDEMLPIIAPVCLAE